MRNLPALQKLSRSASRLAILGAAAASFATAAQADDFVNSGFETGDLTGWTTNGGHWSSGWPIPASDYSGPATKVNVMTAGNNDAITGAPVVFEGTYAVKLNDSGGGNDINVLSQTINSYDHNKVYFAWNAVVEPSHGADDSPNFSIKVLDLTTNTYVLNTAYSAYSAQNSSLFTAAGGFVTSGWKVEDIDVTQGHNYQLIFFAADCVYGGHGGYVYVDGFGNVIPTPNGDVTFDPATDVTQAASLVLPLGGTPNIDTAADNYTTTQLGASQVNAVFDGGVLLVDTDQDIGANFTVQGSGGTINTGGYDSTFTGDIAGAGSLIKIGTGTLRLTGNNSYTGGTAIATGAVEVDSADALGTGYVMFFGGTLRVGAGGSDGVTFDQAFSLTNSNGTLDTTGGPVTLAGGVNGAGVLSIGGGHDVTLASTVSSSSALNLTAGTLTIATQSGGGINGGLILTGGTAMVDNDYDFIGPVIFTGGAFNTGASTVTLSGGATGTSCLIKQGSGKMVLAADASNDIGACVEEGTLSQNAVFTGNVWVYEPGTLRGVGAIIGNTEVAGRLAPGNSPGTMTVNGDVTMLSTGTLQIDIDGTGTGNGAGNFSRLLATGSFTADGTIAPLLRGITGDANNDYTPEVGTTFVVVQANGGVTGAFDTLEQPTDGLAEGTHFDVFYRSNSVVLAITPDSFTDVAGLKGNAGVVATTLDELRTADAGADVRYGIAGLNTSALRTSMQQLDGEIHADVLTAGIEGRRLARGAVGQHLANLRSGRKSVTPISDAAREATGSRKAGDAAAMVERAEPGEVLWVQGIGRTGHVSGDAMAFGYKYDVAGVAAGLDVAVGGGWRLGAGLAAISGDVDARSMDLGHGNAKSTQLFGYASWAQSGYFVDAVVAYGSDRYSTNRTIVLADGAVANDSSAKGHSWAADVSAGARLSLGSLNVEPTVGLRWDRGNRKAVTEDGAAATGLAFGKETLTALQGKAGVRAQHVYALKSVAITAEARAFWLHDFNAANDLLKPALAGASFGVQAANPGRDAASLGAGVSIDTSENVDFYVDYDAQLRKGETAHAVIGGLRVRF